MTTLPDQIKKESIGKIVSFAYKMLRDEINLVEGSREINRLRFNTDSPGDDVFNTFVLTVSDTDDIPLGENVRKNFGPDYLKKADEKLKEYLDLMKPGILKGCKELVKKFS